MSETLRPFSRTVTDDRRADDVQTRRVGDWRLRRRRGQRALERADTALQRAMVRP